MANSDDIKDVLSSLQNSIISQTNILTQILDLQSNSRTESEQTLNEILDSQKSLGEPQVKILAEILDTQKNLVSNQLSVLTEMLNLQKKDFQAKKNKEERERASITRGPRRDRSTRTADERVTNENFREGSAFGEALIGGLLGASGGIASLISVLTAGTAALGLAVVGLRGWEIDAIRSISTTVSNLTDTVIQGATRLRDSILIRYFGFVDNRAPDGLFRGPTISEQITQRIQNLRNSALRLFGLGPDGRPLITIGIDGTEGKSIVGRITRAVSIMLSPLRAVADGVMGFANGAGRSLFNFFERIGKSAGSFTRFIGTILRPLGFIFSAWEGITAFMETEGSIYERLTAGIGTFFGDFIGAPFDLMKNAIAWIIGRLFGIESTDGTYDESTVTGRVLNLVREFSFENLISQVVQAPFRFVGAIWNWISSLFADPVGALTSLWNGYVGVNMAVHSLIWSSLESAINWIINKFMWSSENENEQFDLSDFISTEWARVSAYFSQKFTEFTDYIAGIPERVRLQALSIWNDTSEKLELGFIDLMEWIKSIPDRITRMIINLLDSASFTFPDNVGTRLLGLDNYRVSLISPETVAAANAEREVDPEVQARRNEIIESAARERARIDAAIAAIEGRAISAASSPTVIYAPTTIAPATQVNRGGDSQVQLNAFGGSTRADLDAMSIPGAVQ